MPHFLVDASLPRSTVKAILAAGHSATDVRDIGLGSASDSAIAAHARTNRLTIITRDQDFGNVLLYPPKEYEGIAVIRAPHAAGRTLVVNLVQRFLAEEEVVAQLTNRLAIVEMHRIRLRET